jgi:hypothetical protein
MCNFLMVSTPWEAVQLERLIFLLEMEPPTG